MRGVGNERTNNRLSDSLISETVVKRDLQIVVWSSRGNMRKLVEANSGFGARRKDRERVKPRRLGGKRGGPFLRPREREKMVDISRGVLKEGETSGTLDEQGACSKLPGLDSRRDAHSLPYLSS